MTVVINTLQDVRAGGRHTFMGVRANAGTAHEAECIVRASKVAALIYGI